MERASFTRRIGAFSGATLISRILGYVRDAMVAAYFGGGMVTDSFYAAFKIPNLLRRFLGEGSLTAAFVPVFTQVANKKGSEEADRFFQSLMSGLLIVLAALVALGMAFAPQITQLVAWGFTRDPAKFALTVDLVRLTFPFLIVVSLAALLTAVLNARGKFFVPAVAPSGLSIAEIAFIVFCASKMDSPVHGLAVAAVAGGAIHLVWQIPGLYKEGFHLRFAEPFRHPEVKSVLFLMIPTILGLCADQVNSFVDQFCASFLRDGSITALYNSNRIMQLPLALFGVAVSSVALPSLARAQAEGNSTEYKDLLNYSLRVSNFVLIPSLIGLTVLGFPIVQLLFEHGRFTYENSRMTFAALVPYCLGLPAYSVVKILASGFYARKNTRTPVKVALWAMVLHIVTNILFMRWWEAPGLALSTAVSSWFQAIVLFYLLRQEVGLLGGRSLLKSFLFGSLAGTAMGVICYGLSFYALRELPLFLNVFLSVATGAGAYVLLSKLLRISELDHFVSALTRRRLDVPKPE